MCCAGLYTPFILLHGSGESLARVGLLLALFWLGGLVLSAIGGGRDVVELIETGFDSWITLTTAVVNIAIFFAHAAPFIIVLTA